MALVTKYFNGAKLYVQVLRAGKGKIFSLVNTMYLRGGIRQFLDCTFCDCTFRQICEDTDSDVCWGNLPLWVVLSTCIQFVHVLYTFMCQRSWTWKLNFFSFTFIFTHGFMLLCEGICTIVTLADIATCLRSILREARRICCRGAS